MARGGTAEDGKMAEQRVAIVTQAKARHGRGLRPRARGAGLFPVAMRPRSDGASRTPLNCQNREAFTHDRPPDFSRETGAAQKRFLRLASRYHIAPGKLLEPSLHGE